MKPSFAARAVFSLVLVGIGAILALDSSETPFVVTETPAVNPPAPPAAKPSPKPAPAPIGAGPAEIVCTFRCSNCRRAPSLVYHEGDVLPLWAACKNCGQPMARIDPKPTAAEQPKPIPQQQSYLPANRAAFCRT